VQLWVLVLVAGCGRFSFESRDDAGRSDDDSSTPDSRAFDAAADGVAATTCGLEWVGTLSSQSAVDAWMDEIVIDSQPATCAQ